MRKGDFVPSALSSRYIVSSSPADLWLLSSATFFAWSPDSFSLSLSLWNVDTCLSNDGFFFLFLSLSLFRSIAKNNLVNYYMLGDSLDTILSSEMPVACLVTERNNIRRELIRGRATNETEVEKK